MQIVIKDGFATTGAPLYSSQINTQRARTTSVQMVVRAQDDAEAVATAEVQVSNNSIDWFTAASLETKGTGQQTDGGPYEALWNYTRVVLTKSPAKVNNKGIVDVFMIFRE